MNKFTTEIQVRDWCRTCIGKGRDSDGFTCSVCDGQKYSVSWISVNDLRNLMEVDDED